MCICAGDLGVRFLLYVWYYYKNGLDRSLLGILGYHHHFGGEQ